MDNGLANEANVKSSMRRAGQREFERWRKAEANLPEIQRELERERENGRRPKARLHIADDFLKRVMERFYTKIQYPLDIPLAQSQTLEALANPEVKSSPTLTAFHLI